MTALLTWIVQGLVVFATAAALVRLLPRLNAATRYVIWWLALALVLVPSSMWTMWMPSVATAAPSFGELPVIGSGTSTWLLLPQPPLWAVIAAASVWAGVAAWRLFRIALGFRLVSVLKRESVPFDARRADRLPAYRALTASRRRCLLRTSDRTPGACALGFRHPVILVPRSLAQSLSDGELDQVIAHEHAHLLRYDDWLRLLQCLLTALFGLHPAVWLIARRLDLEREAACDDRVVARTNSARTYAECLARVAALLVRHGRGGVDFAPAATQSAGLLESRVRRLIDGDRNRTSRVSWTPAAACLIALVAAVAVCAEAPPVVTFAEADAGLLPSMPKPIVHSAARVPARLLSPEVNAAAWDLDAVTAAPSSAPAAARRSRPGRRLAGTPPLVAARTRQSEDDPAAAASGLARPAAPIAQPISLISRLPPAAPIEIAVSVQQPPESSTPASAETETGDSWSTIGTNVSRAGVAAGKGAQRFGEAIGGWFSKPWTGKHRQP